MALFGGGKGPGCGFKFAGSSSRVPVRVRRSKPYGNLGVKLYDYDTFTRPPKYKYLCHQLLQEYKQTCKAELNIIASG